MGKRINSTFLYCITMLICYFRIFMADFAQVYYLKVAFYYFSTCKGSDEVYQRRAPQHECWVVQGSLSSHHRTPGPGVSVRRYIYLLYLSVDISICYTSQICRYFSEMSRLLKYRSSKTRCQMSTFEQLLLLKHIFSSNVNNYNSDNS